MLSKDGAAQTKQILLFVPVYNCQKQIARVIERLQTGAKDLVSELLIIDNKSTDGTLATVLQKLKKTSWDRMKVRVFANDNNYGLGGSHKIAYRYAMDNGFNGVITLHGDDQANLADFEIIIDEWKKGVCKAQAILGSRFSLNSRNIGYKLHRRLGNLVLNSLWSVILLRPIPDIGSGLNFLSAQAIAQLDSAQLPDSLLFNPKMLLMLISRKMNILFVPITWREEDQRSNAIPWKIFVSALYQVIAYRLRFRQISKIAASLDRYTYKEVFCAGPSIS